MATNILMPALSPTMTEGTLARWLKHEGDAVKAGDVLAEIETDKATMDMEAVDAGVLGKILVADGTAGVKVNAPIAVLIEEGEAAPDAPAPASLAPAEAAPGPAAAAPPVPTPEQAAPPPAVNGHDTDKIFASPLARRMAKQAGIDLAGLKGSGPGGRIVRADIAAFHGAGAAPGPAAPAEPPPVAPAQAPATTAPHRLAPNSAMRRVIARRLLESHQLVPAYYVTMDIEIDALLKLRAELNGRAPKDGPGMFKLSVNDLVIKAAAATLRRAPQLNASYTDEAMILFDDVDISVAVSMPDGLVTPIVRRADQKGLAAISNEMKDLGARARAGKLKPEEFQGGSFSISNLGMFGARQFTAIINPPQAAILAVGAGEQRPVVRDGALAIATVMTCTLTVDHRVADGALGAGWMSVFKALVEDPLSLML